LLVFDDVATDLLPYQVDGDEHLSHGSRPAVLDIPNTTMYSGVMYSRIPVR